MPSRVAPPHTAAEKRQALADSWGLEQALADLQVTTEGGNNQPHEFPSLIRDAQAHHASLQGFLGDCIDAEPQFERFSEAAPAAHRAFAISELLEQLLSHLDLHDLLRVYLVSRCMRDAIEASPKLLTKLCLVAAPADTRLKTPFRDSLLTMRSSDEHVDAPTMLFDPLDAMCNRQIGFICSHQEQSIRSPGRLSRIESPIAGSLPSELRLRAECLFDRRGCLARPGRRLRQMLICQPPVYYVDISLECCRHRPREYLPDEETAISSPTGLTIGDLYDRTVKVAEAHANCPHAATSLHNSQGRVVQHVLFETNIALHPSDTSNTAEETVPQAQNELRELERQRRQRHKINAYSYHLGDKIPTVKDFAEQHSDETDWEMLARGLISGLADRPGT